MNSFEWLKDLKEGDKVAVNLSNQWHKNRYRICSVTRITPTGRIKLSDGSQYYPTGRTFGDGYSTPLRQITPEIIEFITRRDLLYKINFDSFKESLSSDRLKTLLEWQEELLNK